jgi:signal transduction histidine kinase/ActR/RegA family two-component response regulator
MKGSMSSADLLPALAGPPGTAQVPRLDSAHDRETAVRELGRRSLIGILAQAAAMVFAEVRLDGADGLPRGSVITIYTCFLAIRCTGVYLASRQRGSIQLRMAVLAIGAIGAFAVWGAMVAAVQLRTGTSEASVVTAFVISGVATGAVTALAPIRWIQSASLAMMFLPVEILALAGRGERSFALLEAVFLLYILGQGRAASRNYWQAVRSAELLQRHAEAAVHAKIAADATNLQLRTEIEHSSRMETELRKAQKLEAIGRLAAGIAHEINNPLAYVTGNLEVVAETLEAAAVSPSPMTGTEHAELRSAIGDARDGAERLRKIVDGLRVFSRSQEEQRLPLALAGVLEAAIRMTRNELRHRAELVREIDPVPLVVGDDGRLTQVFINLLVNAAHAIPEGRADQNRITVRTRTDDHGRAVIEVEDSGNGIAPDVQARVFDPFFTTKDVGGGTGLGLSICHGIISGIGGQISIESSADPDHPVGNLAGTGTIVRVVLPPAPRAVLPVAAAPSEPSPAPAAHRPHRRHRVMLVDDEPQVAHTMERVLRRDYDVTITECGRAALDHIARGERFDAIVSDVMMPNMTGLELLDELQRVAPDQAQRLVFLSGGAFTAETRERLGELRVTQLEKPVTAKELRACVLRIANEDRSQP